MKRRLDNSEAETLLAHAGEFHRIDVEQTTDWVIQYQDWELSAVFWETRVHLELVATILRWRLGQLI